MWDFLRILQERYFSRKAGFRAGKGPMPYAHGMLNICMVFCGLFDFCERKTRL